MSKKNITKTSKGVFRLETENVINSQLILNFNPLIKKFQLTGDYKLIHWQAKPKGYREWGIYHSKDDRYESLEEFSLSGNFTSLQLPDNKAVSIPSAVLFLQ